MADEVVDAVVVGGGLAGLSAAYRLADAGRQVLVLERGDAPGSKNVTGGRIYLSAVRRLMPGLFDSAPFERHVVKEMLTVIDGENATQLEHVQGRWRRPPFMSYTVLRARIDNWLSEQAMAKGAFVIPNRRVDDLIMEQGRVAGVRTGGEEIRARIVIAADGALSFMAEKAGLRQPLAPGHFAVAVKEIYALEARAIEERFGLNPGEGAANLFVGATKGKFGGGFLYTNAESLSLGIVVGIEALTKGPEQTGLPELIEAFESRPEIERYIRGAELKEYSAHVVSEAGVGRLSRLFTGGMLVTGDGAGFALNMGITVRGMEFAVASGAISAEVAEEALKKEDFSAEFLSLYERRLRDSFVMKDMETFRRSGKILANPRLYKVYPAFVSSLLDALFTVDDKPKQGLFRSASKVMKEGLLNWQGFKDFLSFRRM
jgi:electron transfer flavoprotein-quinone oxidoreductase